MSAITSLAEQHDACIVVSCDTHVGPSLTAQLRNYCPAVYLGMFDDFAKQFTLSLRTMGKASSERAYQEPESIGIGFSRNQLTSGHGDPHARLRDMNYDGVAAEVIFHGSQNGEPLPFLSAFAEGPDLRMAAQGMRIYNRWLADFVSVEPERRVGLAYVPMWDVDEAVAEVEWAAAAGLRGVNFPSPRPGILEYNRPEWTKFWNACESNNMSLNTHANGGVTQGRLTGPEAGLLFGIEAGGWFARRAVWWMILGGVFERHPSLKLVLTEQEEGWWTHTMTSLDSYYKCDSRAGRRLYEQVPRLPSEYAAENVFIGGSLLSRFQVEDAIINDYSSNLLWGSDYPHGEGTFVFPSSWNEPSYTKHALRHVLHSFDEQHARDVAGLNCVRVYALDEEKLRAVAGRIHALSPDLLLQDPGLPPSGVDLASGSYRMDSWFPSSVPRASI